MIGGELGGGPTGLSPGPLEGYAACVAALMPGGIGERPETRDVVAILQANASGTLVLDVSDILKRAKEAVDSAGLPEDLRTSGFEKAVELLAGQGREATIKPDLRDHTEGTPPAIDLGAIAQDLGVPAEALTDLVGIEEGEPVLDIPQNLLPDTNAEGVRRLAVITVAVRQTAGLQSTSWQAIRDAAERHGVRDTNFSAYMRDTGQWLSSTGTGTNRTFRVRRTGTQQAVAWINEFSGEEPT
jgi:hypothetical protein